MSFDPLVMSGGGRVAMLEATRLYRRTLTARLFVNDWTPTPDADISDIVEASFPGYAGVTIATWGTAYLNGTGNGQSDATIVEWLQTADAPEELVYGVYYTDPAGNWIWAHRRAEGPKAFASEGDTLTFLPSIQDTST